MNSRCLHVAAMAFTAAAAAAQALPDPPAPPRSFRPQLDNRIVQPAPKSKIVCGMMVFSAPDDASERFPILRFTPPEDGPKFSMRIVPAPPCDREVLQLPGPVVPFARPRPRPDNEAKTVPKSDRRR